MCESIAREDTNRYSTGLVRIFACGILMGPIATTIRAVISVVPVVLAVAAAAGTSRNDCFDTWVLSVDAKRAAEACQTLAESGDSEAQHNLGFLYASGTGVTKNYATAAIWFRKAAEQGLARAQFNLGVLYEKGMGVSKDPAEAAHWYRRAAEQGYADAQYNLGAMYERGVGVSQNAKEAMAWYFRAARQGVARAQINIGVMYSQGRIVRRDYIQAYMWFEIAFENADSATDRDLAAQNRAQIASIMTPPQVQEAKRLARLWAESHRR